MQPTFPPAGAAPGDHRRTGGPARGPRRGSDARDPSRPSCGVVCHPHPLYGGTMQNKVVHTLARAMQEAGAPTVRFNFRGVGAQRGALRRAASANSRTRWRPAPGRARTGVASACGSRDSRSVRPWRSRPRPSRSPLHSSPWRRPSAASSWRRSRARPARGSWCRATATNSWTSRPCGGGWRNSPCRRGCVELPGAEHFFHGRLGELRSAVLGFLSAGEGAGA